MGAYFLDSSAVVKRYVDEIGTSWVNSLTDPAAPMTSIWQLFRASRLCPRLHGGGVWEAFPPTALELP